MKLKVNFLIGLSAIVLVALSAIQFYLVKTTYDYKVAQFRGEVKEKIAKITNNFSDIDSTTFNKKDLLYKELAENYFTDPKSRSSIKERILENDFKGELTSKLKRKLELEFPDNDIDFAIVLDKFVIYGNNQKTDTLFSEKPFIKNKIYGNLKSLDNAFLVRSYVGTTSDFTTRQHINSPYRLLTEDTLYVSIENWEIIILKRMALIFIFSIASMLILISLFVIAIKALIKQKKVSDIKTDFINNITHELKTPLTTLSVSTRILERPEIKENENTFNAVLDTINRQNIRLQNLIDQVMTNSLGHDEIELQKEKINLNSFLTTIVDDFKVVHPKALISTVFNTPELSLDLDKFHLTTAINNVLENAVKYGCTEISITTSLKNNNLKISIQDNGIGISKEKHTLLFDKFYRVEKGNLHNTKGLGLGLYYVDQIIKAHKGSVKVISDLGKGATFTISIPSI
ncbi:two-component system sensor histidine kinase [Flavobacterium limnosediminis JC2902]|uniref:histidine kinase n=1 Tax=Flavobacterium limnosediminis JC2902 TaxID=1341181 RepID=V6SLQ3_9FLAO|nr:HAMP domain-containing sensor histidine kinase [Flavobacterium limnosediminis]ESU27152.1 two-component system sensor histidine kinase [Flavobacterium limnosediminis JC2902]